MGFDGTRVDPIGVIDLSVTAAKRTLKENFVLTEIHPSYNLIMGRGWIHQMNGVPSTLHQVMRCLSPGSKKSLLPKYLKAKEEAEAIKLNEESLETVEVILGNPQKVTCVRLGPFEHDYDHSDMIGINPSISCHNLKVNPAFKPVKQRHRRFTPERNRIITEDMGKLLQAGFIREVHYPQLMALKRDDGSKEEWEVEDSFPLPKIDQMVDATTGYERLTFLDAYSGYN
ncbi:uncharacterized protein LOC132305325 [Cornus florida]|uniref:uncharacterized protein LOC132305325 n=1 Tax=Cornus florida TaxID=4283 RepID=UPI00289D4142|nr:uncharacterized protein LOC132305325 [Cornus florida]